MRVNCNIKTRMAIKRDSSYLFCQKVEIIFLTSYYHTMKMNQGCLLILQLSLLMALSFFPHLGTSLVVQNVIPLCEEMQCPELQCRHPARLNGECCPICVEPGMKMQDKVALIMHIHVLYI